jgi:hypothetical protein
LVSLKLSAHLGNPSRFVGEILSGYGEKDDVCVKKGSIPFWQIHGEGGFYIRE